VTDELAGGASEKMFPSLNTVEAAGAGVGAVVAATGAGRVCAGACVHATVVAATSSVPQKHTLLIWPPRLAYAPDPAAVARTGPPRDAERG
jgi:hypothetical protein